MRYLFISICLLFLVGCKSFQKSRGLTELGEVQVKEIHQIYFSDTSKDYVFDTQLSFRGRSFSSLLIIKKLTSNDYRIVLATKMGNTMADFSFKNDELSVNSILPDFNRKALLKILEKDFSVLLRDTYLVNKSYRIPNNPSKLAYKTSINKRNYYLILNDSSLNEIVYVNSTNKERINYTFDTVDGLLDKISINHRREGIELELKILP